MSSPAKLLDVGNCDPDHSTIRCMLSTHFNVEIDRVMFVDDALAKMRERRYALVLFNRLIFDNGSEGIELLRRTRSDSSLSAVPIMMISNFAEAQDACVAAGGVRGFGKAAVNSPETAQLLSQYLPKK